MLARWLILAGGVLIVAVVLLLAFPLGPTLRIAHREGVYAPAFSLDGNSVYFVHREAWAVWYANLAPVWSPFGDGAPVTSLIFGDHISLRRVDRDRKLVDLIEDWPPTPLSWHLGRSHFAAIFGSLRARLDIDEEHGVQYAVSLATPDAASVRYTLFRRWDERRQGIVSQAAWRQSRRGVAGRSTPLLNGEWELFTVRGEPLFPGGILAFNHVTDEVDMLVQLGPGPSDPREVSPQHLRRGSQRAEIERRAALDRTRQEQRQYFAQFGLSDFEIARRVTRELQRRGLLAREDALVAVELSAAEAEGEAPPLFEISETELASGIFDDIRLALASPGVAVRGPQARYLTYRGFTTSERLNAHLAAGGDAFRVAYKGRVYLLRLVPDGFPPPAGPETITARPARAGEFSLPGGLVIDIAPSEAAASRYPDIVAALSHPGTPVTKRVPPYQEASEADWATRQLNDYLFEGNKRLRARYRGRVYTLSIEAVKE